MTNLIIQVSKYLIIILMALYTLQCYTVFGKKDEDAREYLFLRQNMLMFAMHFVAFTVLYLQRTELTLLLFYGAQALYLAAVLILFRNLYPLASRLLINNMCMLICTGFIMITRLDYDKSIKQFKIAVISTVVALLIPIIIRKLRFITKMYWFYTLAGIGLLALVAIAATSTYGAKLSFSFGGISVQPSEFVKIIYVFAIAGLLTNAKDFKKLVIATALAAIHVLILVVSKDLGSAMIFFVTYLVMLFVSTRNPFLVLTGILAGSGAAVGAYFLFAHIRVRVQAWTDPFKDYQGGGYQICQSLFSISAGSWFGTGLCQGSPNAIPFVEHVFCHRGGAWHDLWHLPDSRLHELFYHVCEYRDAAFEPLLPSGGGGPWKHLCGTDLSDSRRRYQTHSDDGRDAAICELWWQFDAEYTDHVCSRAGTLHAAAG